MKLSRKENCILLEIQDETKSNLLLYKNFRKIEDS